MKKNTLDYKVYLTLIITTYGRPSIATKNIKKIASQLEKNRQLQQFIKLIVVNNGSTSDIPTINNTTIINSHNLGGAGGFARGLYEASKDPNITHCLFMDDDAACDIDAIIKTYEILASSNNPNLAIAGSMAFEHKPNMLHESGAHMRLSDLTYRANKHGIDLKTEEGLKIFHQEEHIDYGGWWFYAFPIKHTPYYPFPFFVRGDDVLFGLMNPHTIKTDIDIISTQMCFLRKFTPWVIYLVFRASFVHGSYRKKPYSPFVLLLYFNYHVLRYSMGYRYTVALAIIEAFKDGNKGLDFWREHIDALEPMARIKALEPQEVYNKPFETYHPESYEQTTPLKQTTWPHRLLYCLTLNGHLLPGFLLKDKPYAVSETLLSPVSYAFRRRKVLIINETTGKTMALIHSKKLFFSILFKMSWLSFKALFTLNKTMKAYQEGIPSMCTREFWEGVFKAYGCLGEPADEVNAYPRENDREAQE